MNTLLCTVVAVVCIVVVAEGIEIGGGGGGCACPSIYDPVCAIKDYSSTCDRDCANALPTSLFVFNQNTGKCEPAPA